MQTRRISRRISRRIMVALALAGELLVSMSTVPAHASPASRGPTPNGQVVPCSPGESWDWEQVRASKEEVYQPPYGYAGTLLMQSFLFRTYDLTLGAWCSSVEADAAYYIDASGSPNGCDVNIVPQTTKLTLWSGTVDKPFAYAYSAYNGRISVCDQWVDASNVMIVNYVLHGCFISNAWFQNWPEQQAYTDQYCW